MQTVILHNLIHKQVLEIKTNYNSVEFDGTKLEMCFLLSPLMTIADMKEYIISELDEVIEIGDVESLKIWSPSANIEFDHSYNIYSPRDSANEFTRSQTPITTSIFEYGPIYITGDFAKLKIKPGHSINLRETFFKTLYRKYHDAKSSYTHVVEYSNIFRSIFQYTDYEKLKQVAASISSDIKTSIFIRLNDELLATGNIIPLRIPSDFFTIIITRGTEELLFINEKKMFVTNITFFENFITTLIQLYPSFTVPERYYNSVHYIFTSSERVSNRFSDYENIDLFFIQTQSWDADNILQSKNKKLSVFLSSYGIKIRSSDPQDFFAVHSAQLLFAYSTMNELAEGNVKFDKIKGIYWSRICQNIGDEIRKPVKKIELKQVEHPEYQAMVDGSVFECLQNSGNNFIGFLKKPYELSNICLPCCYNRSQTDKKLYKKCTLAEEYSMSSLAKDYFSLFIIDNNRIIAKNRLGMLDDIVDDLLNDGAPVVIDEKLLISCNKFFFSNGNDSHFIDTDNDSLIRYLKENPQHVIIRNQSFLTSMFIDITEPIAYKVLIKNFLYGVIRVTKQKSEDGLVIESSYSLHSSINPVLGVKKSTHVSLDNFIAVPLIITQKNNNKIIVKGEVENTINITHSFNETI